MLKLDGIIANIYVPNTLKTTLFADAGVPIIADNSIYLDTLNVSVPKNMSLKNEFFDSLKNAPNLSILYLNRMSNLEITSISDYLKDELPSVTYLNLNGASNVVNNQSVLQDLEGIEKFTNLQTLSMDYTSANLDISAIKNCPTLTTVNLGYCNIQSLSGLEGLTNLQSLTLRNNNITGVKELENLTNLTSLNLQNNLISDTSTYINESGETVTYNNLEILANLNSNRNGKLTTLLLSGNNNIINWTPVSSLTWSSKSGF